MNLHQLINSYKEKYPLHWREKLAEQGIIWEAECLYQVPEKSAGKPPEEEKHLPKKQ